MIRLIPEQIKCENCGFVNLVKYPAFFQGKDFPEYIQRFLKGYKYSCKNCGTEYPLDREITIQTESGELTIHTTNKKEEIEKKFLQHGLIDNLELD